MTVLTAEDLKPFIRDARLNQILHEDTNGVILGNTEDIAIQEVKDAIFSRYNFDTIKINIDDYPQVKRWVATIILYYLHRRLPDQIVPPAVIRDYDEVKETLMAIADGKRSVSLPLIQTTNQDGTTTPVSKFRWGSNTQRTH